MEEPSETWVPIQLYTVGVRFGVRPHASRLIQLSPIFRILSSVTSSNSNKTKILLSFKLVSHENRKIRKIWSPHYIWRNHYLVSENIDPITQHLPVIVLTINIFSLGFSWGSYGEVLRSLMPLPSLLLGRGHHQSPDN